MQFRKVERKTASGDFEEIKFADLKTGDHFKLDDGDVEPKYEDGTKVYVALSDATPCEPEGNFGVRADEVA